MTWSRTDWRRSAVVSAVVATLAVTVPAATVVSCNVHEVTHALVGTAVGWTVDEVTPCTPGGGQVRYSQSSARGDAIEGWAGGLGGALVLVALCWLVTRGDRPWRSPVVWAVGLGLTVPIGPQLVLAALEGTSSANYSERISNNPGVWVPIILFSAAVGPAWYLWRWRQR